LTETVDLRIIEGFTACKPRTKRVVSQPVRRGAPDLAGPIRRRHESDLSHQRLTLSELYQGDPMAKVCQVTGKAPMVGNNVSHANNKTKRRFLPNLQNRRFWVESENRWVRLRITNAALRLIDKKGIDVVLADLRARDAA